ncbi:hypothetical protein V8C40DRAFT_247798 [Trichoderma camerunense]
MYKRIGNQPRFLFIFLFFPLGGRDGWPPIKRNYLRLRPFGPCYVGSVSVRCAASLVCPFLYIHTRCCQAIKRWPLMALPPA